ncbi:Mlo-like protein, partial [Thalictrum thalictroides]
HQKNHNSLNFSSSLLIAQVEPCLLIFSSNLDRKRYIPIRVLFDILCLEPERPSNLTPEDCQGNFQISDFGLSAFPQQIRGWKEWEEETLYNGYDFSSDASRFRPTHEAFFVRSHNSFWTKNPIFYYDDVRI